jgi:PEP-CTERM motif-containing protein
LLGAGAVLAGALAFEFSVASFGGMGMAEAAANQAKSVIQLLDERSPGARTAAELTKTKRHALSDRELAPKPALPANLAEVLAPPESLLAPVETGAPPAELAAVLSTPPGDILLPPPGGGVTVPPPGGGGVVPPGGGDTPPGGGDTPPQPPGPPDHPPPPAVPEPGTWMTMILGFGLIGWMFRRNTPARALA